jgi:hypothetical protein
MNNCLCPVVTSFEVVDKLLDHFEDIHDEPVVSRGVVALNRRCVEAVRQVYPCDGPTRNERGSISCPLAGMFSDVYALVTLKSHPTVIAPEKVIAAERERSTGQYL